MNVNPLVSIVVPVYNVKKYLSKCIDSVVQQSYKNIEVILVDDGSTDESGAICDAWVKKDKRIKVIHKNNEGLNYARKDGFLKSSGKYVTFLDSDDFFHKDAVKNSLKTLLDTNADVVVYASKEFSDQDIEDVVLKTDKSNDTRIIEGKDPIALYAFFGEDGIPGIQYMTVWGKLYTRDILNNVDWDAANYRLYEDNFWTPQVLLQTKKVTLLSTPLLFYRRNVAYGASGENLGNRMIGNSINGEPVGYIEFVEQLRKYYQKLAREYGFKASLDKRINRQAFLSKTWRIDNLVRANILDEENNLKYVLEVLPQYIEAKNEHINNLGNDIRYLHEKLDESNQNLDKVTSDFGDLLKAHEEFTGIKRSARLLAGNIKRRIIKQKN